MARIDQDRALAALLGLAVGDALGSDGEPASDTRLALRLADSIISRGGFDPDHALDSYVAWYREDPDGASPTMREVLESVSGGLDAYRATSQHSMSGQISSGNEPVVRATPLGIAFAGRSGLLRDATLADAALTHFDPLAGKAALLHGEVIAGQLTMGPRAVYEELKDPSHLDDRLEDFVIPAVNASTAHAEHAASTNPGSAVATLAVGIAAYFNAESFEDGLTWAVNLGGDTGATGAVTGALLGARFGTEAIPQSWAGALPEQTRAHVERAHRGLMQLVGA